MSSIQFNYFADEKGEQIIRQELLDRFGSLYARDYFGENKSIIKETEDFPKMPFEIYLTCEKLATQINTLSGKLSISIYDSPVVEYTPSKIRDENVYVQGRLAYFAGNEFPELKKTFQCIFRKLKKQCWKDKQWNEWVFETIGDEATVFIPNRVVHLKRE